MKLRMFRGSKKKYFRNIFAVVCLKDNDFIDYEKMKFIYLSKKNIPIFKKFKANFNLI